MKKLITITLGVVLLSQVKLSAQTNTFPATGSVGVGTTTPVSSAIVEMQTTSQGLLAPRMTKVQRDAIVAPATGLLIFQTNSTPGFYYYSGASWTAISTKGANTSLSNLAAATAINAALTPNTNNTLDLGSTTANWNELYVNSIKFMDGSTQATAGGGATYTAGTGISVAGTVITNTGDTNGADDVTNATNHSGDITGLFNNLQIGTGAVGSTEIADGTVSSTDILNATIAADDLSAMGAASGQIMQWNGTSWVATTPAGTTYTAGTGISIAGTVITNTGDTNGADDVTNATNHSGDITGLFNNLQIGTGAVGSTEIADGTVSSTDILNATIAADDLSAMGAASGQIMQWNGTSWVATTPAGTTYTAGTGISIAGTVITNTGDTNGADDVTNATNHSGDITGLFNNLQIGSGAVGSTEIADGTVSSTDILNSTIAAADLSAMGAISGQVMQWNGTSWLATTPAAGAETDPQVGVISTDFIPRWNGTSLVTGAIVDNGDNISVGWNSTGIDLEASASFYNNESIVLDEDAALKAVNQTVSVGGTATELASAKLGFNSSGMFIFEAPVSHVGVWGNASTTTGNSAAVYANNYSTGTTNYGVVAKSFGAGTTNYGIWAKAYGATNNYAGYFDGDVVITGTDQTLTVQGTDPYIQMVSGFEDIGYLRADGEDIMLALNAANDDGKLILRSNGVNRMYINDNGDIVMGSTTVAPKAGYKLSVDGKVVCEELLVQLSPWPDYVFKPEYKLASLLEIEQFILKNNHLPGIPTAAEVESEGLNVGQMQQLMMEKIEELTLHMIDLKKENDALKAEVEALKK